MKGVLNIIVVVLAAANIIYHLVTCPLCDEKLFGYTVSGYAYLAFWLIGGLIALKATLDSRQKKL